MQVKDLLGELTNRDEARKLDRPMLENLNLRGCGLKDQDLDSLHKSFPTVLIHQKPPSVLESSTWVEISKSVSMT